MTTPHDEVQILLDELDTRLDRLRALYEQYFVGFEKTEPHVQKKDVERRVQALRKMQLRNTAARFRFQSLVQKYTTYQTYWQRIVRQIEEGTFKRDVMRAQRYGRPEAVRTPEPTQDIETLDADALMDDEGDVVAAVTDASLKKGLLHLSDAFEEEVARGPVRRPSKFMMRAITAVRPVESSVEELPLDEIESAQPPDPIAPVKPAAPKVPVPRAGAVPQRVGFSPFGAAPAPRAAPTAPVAKPPSGPPRRRSSANQKAAKATGSEVPVANPAPAAKPIGGPPRRKSSGSMKAVRPPVAPVPAPPSSSTPAGRAVTGPDDPALRSLYERYRDARQRNGEGDVGYDAVARQVKDALPRLADKYPGQNVSLDVAVKDGKTILRPVVHAPPTPKK